MGLCDFVVVQHFCLLKTAILKLKQEVKVLYTKWLNKGGMPSHLDTGTDPNRYSSRDWGS